MPKSVTYVSGIKCYLCLRKDKTRFYWRVFYMCSGNESSQLGIKSRARQIQSFLLNNIHLARGSGVPTIKEYYDADFNRTLSCSKSLSINERDGSGKEKLISTLDTRVHVDYIANAVYISCFIPAIEMNEIEELNLCDLVLNPQQILQIREQITIESGLFFEERQKANQMIFTKIFYIYSENYFTNKAIDYLKAKARELNLLIKIRGPFYAEERTKLAVPRAFMSHDSRDKADIARPLFDKLRAQMCTVWYDEYSLRIGDSLRENIEKGIKECKKCILIISPNFLTNSGWTKIEFNSIFNREIIEGENFVLPVWHNITRKEVYDYCPSLIDKMALSTEEGLDSISKKIYSVLMN